MNRAACSLVILVAATCTLGFAGTKQPAAKVKDWYVDYDRALKASYRAQKPVMILFTDLSGGCSPSDELEEKVFTTAAFKEWAKRNVVLLRSDRNRALTKKYNYHGISGIPSVLFVNGSGTAISDAYFGDASSAKGWVEGAKKVLANGID